METSPIPDIGKHCENCSSIIKDSGIDGYCSQACKDAHEDVMGNMKVAMLHSDLETFMRMNNLIEGEKEEFRKIGRLWKNDVVCAHRVYHMAKNKTPLTAESLIELHGVLWHGQGRLDKGGGMLRKEPVAVFKNGVEVWRAPNPGSLRRLLVIWEDSLPKMDAWEAHNLFEKIHPFIDLNGRIGRLIWLYCMMRDGEDPFGLTFLHQYYYQTLRHQKDVS